MAERPDFFAARPPGHPGIALFLNAGDPPLAALPELVDMLDKSQVDCLELAVPFPDSFTDGPVVRRSARRALATGVDLDQVLDRLAEVHTGLHHLQIVLLADWSHTIRPLGMDRFLGQVNDSAADALLVHGLPPALRADYYAAAAGTGLRIVTTCYPNSTPEVQAESAANASAYLYLVAHYGRTGSTPAGGYQHLSEVIPPLRANTTAPIAVGFGVRGRSEIEALGLVGADAAIVGSAAVSRVERALADRRDVVADLEDFVTALRPERAPLAGRNTP